MRTDEAHVNHPIRVVDLDHEPVVVRLDVEDHSTPFHDARVAVLFFHLLRRTPVLLFDLAIPRQERLLRLRIELPDAFVQHCLETVDQVFAGLWAFVRRNDQTPTYWSR